MTLYVEAMKTWFQGTNPRGEKKEMLALQHNGAQKENQHNFMGLASGFVEISSDHKRFGSNR